MKQLTIRGFDKELEAKILKLAEQEKISLNQAVLRLLRKGADLGEPRDDLVVGAALDSFIGTWSDEEARELMDAVADFEVIDESLWK